MSSCSQCERMCNSGKVCDHTICHEAPLVADNDGGNSYLGNQYSPSTPVLKSKTYPLKANKNSKVSKQTHIVEELSETGEVQYHCTSCGKRFRSRTQKYYHLQCNQLDELYECDICNKSFARQSQLKYHREAHVSPINECQKCQKTFSNPLALKKHEGLHKVEPKPCPHCDKTFLKKISLEQHIAAQHLHQLQYGCAYCNKKYASKSTLQLHLQSHEEKRFECSFCGKLFQRNSILNLHLKRHYHTSTYKCQVCGKAFGESGALARHRKIHEENTLQYHCLLCDKSILRKDNMARHMNTIHPEEKYEDIVQIKRPSPQKSIEQIPNETQTDNRHKDKTGRTEHGIKNVEGIAFLNESQPSINHSMNLNDENPAESQSNFLIIENKLLQKPLKVNKPEEVNETYAQREANEKGAYCDVVEQSKNCSNNTSLMDPLPNVNQIQVIKTLPAVVNLIEVPFNNTNTLQELAGKSLKYNQDVQNQNDWLRICPVEEQVETQMFFNPSATLNQQQYVVCQAKSAQDLQQHTKPTFIQESNCLISNSLIVENNGMPSNEYVGSTNNPIRNTSSVIRSIGNVKRNLTPHLPINENIPTANISLDYEYKHKKYNRHYNLDLYRKILGCDDDEDDDNDCGERNASSHCPQEHDILASYNLQQDNSSEATNATAAVHWRKSFKNIYETTKS